MASNSNALEDTPQSQLQALQPQIPKLGYASKRKSRQPQIVKDAVLLKKSFGLSKSQIAKDLDISRPTVDVILSQADILQHVTELRSDMVLNGDLVKSVRVMRQKLAKGSESAATTILRGFNVLQSNPKVEVNVLNLGAAAYAQRIQAKAQESIDAEIVTSQLATTTNSDSDPSKT